MGTVVGQTPEYSQIFTNYISLNPSYVGMTECPHVYTTFRTRTLAEDTYNSAYMSYDMSFRRTNGNFGLSVEQDMQSQVYKETEVLCIYAHTFQLQKYLWLRASLAAGFVRGMSDYSNLIFSDMINVMQEPLSQTGESLEKIVRNNFNSEAGVLLYNSFFSAGMTVHNLQGNVTADNKNANIFPRIFSFHGMAKFSTTIAYTQKYLIWFYPHVNLVFGGTSSYAQVGLILQKWMLQLGGGYRQNFPCNANSLSFFVGVVEKKFRFAYNCDMTRKLTKRFGTHEVSLSYQFDCHVKKKKMEAVKAPTF